MSKSNKRFIIVVTVLLSCVAPTRQTTGTISETDTGCVIEGIIQNSDKTPVANANITLHDQRTLKIITLSKARVLVRSGKTQTNINGIFHIDSVDTGIFLVEINDHDSIGALVQTRVKHLDTLVVVNSTLGHLGTIIGKIDISKLNVVANAVLYLPEINRKVSFDSLGYFVIKNLAPYNYHLRFASGDSSISMSSDTVRIPVTPGDTTRVESLGAKAGTVIINGNVIETPGIE